MALAKLPAALDGSAGESAVRALADDYLQLLDGMTVDALRVVDKLPANFQCLGLIHEALPNARIIHMQRHPIDTCLSIYFQDFHAVNSYASDLGDLAHYYGEYRRLMTHWRSTLPGVMLDVPYEGLIEHPEAWSRKMVEFVGLPWDPACLDFNRSDRVILTFSKWQARQKNQQFIPLPAGAITRSSLDRWPVWPTRIRT